MYKSIVFIFFTTTSMVVAFTMDSDFVITDGIKLIKVPVANSIEDGARSFGGNVVLSKMADFLQGHEVLVKLPKIFDKNKMTSTFDDVLKTLDQSTQETSVTGRGKGGGGAGLLAMMFAKGLAAIGIGGLALLTFKALAVAALALLLSAVVGVKKLSHQEQDDHQVIYAGHGHHHRRKRDVDTPLPYRGWREYTAY